MRTNRGKFTAGALMGNVALVLPAGTVTFCGVTTDPSMLPNNRTRAPPAGAGPVSVTVAMTVPPAWTVSLESDRLARLGSMAGLPGGSTASQVSGARYPSNPVPLLRTTLVGTDTGAVVMLK